MAGYAVRTSFGAMQRLHYEIGVPGDFIARLYAAGDLAAARVHIEDDGSRWGPEGNAPRLLLGVREGGGLVDVLALDSRNRNAWALRRCDASLLGFDLWARVLVMGEGELRLFATPFDWLAGGGNGICVLTWDAVALAMLRNLGGSISIMVESHHREPLLQRLRWEGLPRVRAVVPGEIRGAA